MTFDEQALKDATDIERESDWRFALLDALYDHLKKFSFKAQTRPTVKQPPSPEQVRFQLRFYFCTSFYAFVDRLRCFLDAVRRGEPATEALLARALCEAAAEMYYVCVELPNVSDKLDFLNRLTIGSKFVQNTPRVKDAIPFEIPNRIPIRDVITAASQRIKDFGRQYGYWSELAHPSAFYRWAYAQGPTPRAEVVSFQSTAAGHTATLTALVEVSAMMFLIAARDISERADMRSERKRIGVLLSGFIHCRSAKP